MKATEAPATKGKDFSKGMESTVLIRGCNIFKENPVKIGECQTQVIKLLNALNSGYEFTSKDIEEIFFSITLIYNNKDLLLHRLLSLLLKHLHTSKEIAIMIVNSLSKDIISDISVNKAVAVRIMPHLFNPDAVISQERYIKQLISSRDPLGVSSSLMCALSLCFQNHVDIVKKWVPEIHSVATTSGFAQYHALLVLYSLRQGDGTLLNKMAEQLKDRIGTFAFSNQVLFRVCLDAANQLGNENPMGPVISKLQCSNDRIILDAARAVLSCKYSSQSSILAAVTKLNSLLSKGYRVSMFASLRTIAQYAPLRRNDFELCNVVLERLLNDHDSTLSAMAAMCLLHTGFESTIERVLPSISSFSSKLSPDQQASLLSSCVEVGKRCPGKITIILTFMWNTFRLIDNINVQNLLVNSFIGFATESQVAKTHVFKQLCEYVEDSKFSELTLSIVQFIGKFGPKEENRMELVRCLCNRLFLETSDVRAASLESLSMFANCEDVGGSVRRVIHKYLSDPDDEVRDRAAFFVSISSSNIDSDRITEKPKPSSKQDIVVDEPVKAEQSIEEALFSRFGNKLLSSNEVYATETDADIAVSYVIHIFAHHIIFEYTIHNSLDFEIRNISVLMESDSESFINGETIPCDFVKPNSDGKVYIHYPRDPKNLQFADFVCTIVFYENQDDESEQTFDFDSELRVKIGAYMKPAQINNYNVVFAEMPIEQSDAAQFRGMKTIEDVINYFVQLTNLSVISQEQKGDKKKPTTLIKMAGLVLGEKLVLVQAEVMPPRPSGVAAKITVKAESEDIVQAVVSSLLE